MTTPTTSASPDTVAVTVLLTDDQIAVMDNLSVTIRRHTGKAVSRSAMIRAIVSAALPHHSEWLTCGSEAEIRETIAKKMDLTRAVHTAETRHAARLERGLVPGHTAAPAPMARRV